MVSKDIITGCCTLKRSLTLQQFRRYFSTLQNSMSGFKSQKLHLETKGYFPIVVQKVLHKGIAFTVTLRSWTVPWLCWSLVLCFPEEGIALSQKAWELLENQSPSLPPYWESNPGLPTSYIIPVALCRAPNPSHYCDIPF